MQHERFHFNYGILLAIGLIGLAIMTGMVRLGWSGTPVLDLIQEILVGVAIACGVTYLIGKVLGRYLQDRSRSANKLQGAAAMDHNPPRPGQPISRDRTLPFARGQAYEAHAKRSSPQTSFHRSPETPKGRRGQQTAGRSGSLPSETGTEKTSSLNRSRFSPPVVQQPADAASRSRRHRRRRGGRGKAPSSSTE